MSFIKRRVRCYYGGGAGKERKACNLQRLWDLNSASTSPMAPRQLMSDFRQSGQSGNERECKQTLKNMWKHAPRVMTSLLMSSPPMSISHRLFRCRYSNSRDVIASYPSLPRRTCSQAKSCCTDWTLITARIRMLRNKGNGERSNITYFETGESCR